MDRGAWPASPWDPKELGMTERLSAARTVGCVYVNPVFQFLSLPLSFLVTINLFSTSVTLFLSCK